MAKIDDEVKNLRDQMSEKNKPRALQKDMLSIKGKYRKLAAMKSIKHKYTKDPVTLALGVCEEAGEIGKAVNWYYNSQYIPSPNREAPDTIEHEINDILMYLAMLCNASELDIDF